MLGGLQSHLMDVAHVGLFCAEYTRHMNRLRSEALASQEGYRAELRKIDKELDRLVDAIAGGRTRPYGQGTNDRARRRKREWMG